MILIYVTNQSADCKGPGVAGNTSLKVKSLMTLFCKIKILTTGNNTAQHVTTLHNM